MESSARTNEVGIDGDLTLNCGQRRKGTVESRRCRLSLHDSSLLEVQGIEAELRGYPTGLRVASIDGEGARPELGFRSMTNAYGLR
jgi:hypothetical protein